MLKNKDPEEQVYADVNEKNKCNMKKKVENRIVKDKSVPLEGNID